MRKRVGACLTALKGTGTGTGTVCEVPQAGEYKGWGLV